MEMIKPHHVTFEQAKWLREKGFNIPTNYFYFEDGEFRENTLENDSWGNNEYDNWNNAWLTKKSGDRCFGCKKENGYFETYSAPEQHFIVEWLRIKHSIWVEAILVYKNKWEFNIYNCEKCEILSDLMSQSDSPQEAISAALDYVLKELI